MIARKLQLNPHFAVYDEGEKNIQELVDPNNDGTISVKEAKLAAKVILQLAMDLNPNETKRLHNEICSSPVEFANEFIKVSNGEINIPYKDNPQPTNFKISEEAIRAGVKSLCESDHMQEEIIPLIPTNNKHYESPDTQQLPTPKPTPSKPTPFKKEMLGSK